MFSVSICFSSQRLQGSHSRRDIRLPTKEEAKRKEELRQKDEQQRMEEQLKREAEQQKEKEKQKRPPRQGQKSSSSRPAPATATAGRGSSARQTQSPAKKRYCSLHLLHAVLFSNFLLLFFSRLCSAAASAGPSSSKDFDWFSEDAASVFDFP